MPITRREYTELLAKLDAEYARKKREIESAWRVFGEKDDLVDPLAAIEDHRPVGLKACVVAALAKIDGDFTINVVRKIIMQDYPEQVIRTPALSTCLLNLRDSKVIDLIERGTGRRPSTYRKK